VRSLVVITKLTRSTSPEAPDAGEETVSHYVSTLVPQRAKRFAQLVRGHWGGCEIRNHWVRDALFEEDKTLSKNQHLNGNLAVLRCALISLKSRLAPHLSWPALFELSGLKTTVPYNIICNNTFK
jgi:predicted transposase YbfD/YdcC